MPLALKVYMIVKPGAIVYQKATIVSRPTLLSKLCCSLPGTVDDFNGTRLLRLLNYDHKQERHGKIHHALPLAGIELGADFMINSLLSLTIRRMKGRGLLYQVLG